jgi:hypothetical protein
MWTSCVADSRRPSLGYPSQSTRCLAGSRGSSSNVTGCGTEPRGGVVDGQLEAQIEFGCEQPDTVGPIVGGALHGQIVRT